MEAGLSPPGPCITTLKAAGGAPSSQLVYNRVCEGGWWGSADKWLENGRRRLKQSFYIEEVILVAFVMPSGGYLKNIEVP